MTRIFLIGCLAGLAVACAGIPGRPMASSAATVTGEELVATQAPTVYDALSRIRPSFLRSRTGSGNSRLTAVVYVDNIRYGSIESLKSLLPGDVDVVEYLDAPTATTRYGSGHMGGAIVIRTKA